MKDTKAKIEAVLFCSQDGIDTKSLAKACGLGSSGHVKSALQELRSDYEKRGSGLKITEKDGLWHLSVQDKYLNLVKDSARPEISKAVLETLAYIAHKKKIRQSDVIRIRSNKAYEHIKELLERGLIEAKKDGSTQKLSPTRKFYDYFDLNEDDEIIESE